MNICLLNDSFPPVIDGVANAVMNYAQDLTAMGNTAMVVTPAYPDVTDDYPYEVVRYHSLDTTKLVGYRTGMPFDSDATKRMYDFKPDIYHSHCPMVSTVMARGIREIAPAPLVFTYHTKFDIDIENAIRGKLLQEAAILALVRNIETCDEVWTVSEGAGQNLKSLGYQGDYRVMRNGVDIPRKKPDPESVAKVKGRHDLPEDVPVYLFVGRMMWYKGLRTILDALRGLSDAEIDYRMIFVGGGGDFEEVKAYADDLRLGDKVIFTGPIQDRQLLRGYFGAADLFLFLSDFDTNGLVVREAAACGLGSLLLRGSAAAEDVENKHNGFLTERSAASVAALLARIGMDKAALRSVGENAMNELYFSWEDSVKIAYERYEQIVDDYRSGKLTLKKTVSEPMTGWLRDAVAAMEESRKLREKSVSGAKAFLSSVWEDLINHDI